ncbi:MAG: V-type ATP synthase subunit D [Candidatus Andersenbacteria bacterium CG10_big_fil_rev_8_21_14_0_10_54_11]|uniref:V-type ATP synthase subunit D n=1 Tax=Candidatus Andersenbacteria bacterium CG10_big_fil_rev_8_21_14_0_10_54_11 TaxID=1974485 RepID=A0A2M6WY31_9BACT|nr:MAG: V-type ATP synthase subunit D [Candidatus Andersenbacteria bacterium CG10_big_fil_rev_8_21_14_0_10_54_11]
MATIRVNPTRMELLRLKKRTVLAQKGYKLLKEKRDGLMREFLTLIRAVRKERAAVDRELQQALFFFTMAQGAMHPQAVQLVSQLQLQRVATTGADKNVMGVRIPDFKAEITTSEEALPIWQTAPELDLALEAFRRVLPKLLNLAAKEKAALLLAQEIETTRRRVNALEHVLLPALQKSSRYIRMKLEEQGRAAVVATMKVKESQS